MMKTAFLTLVATGVIGIGAASAEAGDNYYAPRHAYGHHRYHDRLEHRDFHRYQYHRDAHRSPMTWGQHGRLHDNLEHDRYHDRLEHRQYHRNRYYSPYRYGYRSSQRSGLSFFFGW